MTDTCDECDREFTTSAGGATIYYELGIGDVCPTCRREVVASTRCARCGNRDPMAAEWGTCVDCTLDE